MIIHSSSNLCNDRIKIDNTWLICRYKKFYPSENNEWGEFQAHRKALGIICFARCRDPSELNDLYKFYESVKAQYGNTLYDSRLIVFGLDPNECGSHAGTPDVARRTLPIEMSVPLPENGGTERAPVSANGYSVSADLGPLGKSEIDIVRTDEKSGSPDVTSRQSTKQANSSIPDVVPKSEQRQKTRRKLDSAIILRPPNGNLIKPGDSTVGQNIQQSPQRSGAGGPSERDNNIPAIQLSTSDQSQTDKENVTDAVNHSGNHGDKLEVRPDRSSSMTSQSSDSSGSSFTRDAPPYVIFFLDPEDCPKLEGKV